MNTSFWVNVPRMLIIVHSHAEVHLSFGRMRKSLKVQTRIPPEDEATRTVTGTNSHLLLLQNNTCVILFFSLSTSLSFSTSPQNHVTRDRKCDLGAETPTTLCFTFGDLPGLPQFLHGDVLVFAVQVAVFIGLLLLHVFYYELGKKKRR